LLTSPETVVLARAAGLEDEGSVAPSAVSSASVDERRDRASEGGISADGKLALEGQRCCSCCCCRCWKKGCELSNRQLCVRRRHTAAFASPFHVVASTPHILYTSSSPTSATRSNSELVLLSLLQRMSKFSRCCCCCFWEYVSLC
jgi:hypothetical protein